MVNIIEYPRFGLDILADERFMGRFLQGREKKKSDAQSSPGKHCVARFATKEAVV